MEYIKKALIGLAAVSFLLAAIGTLIGRKIMPVPPEAFSRACTNLALIAIGLSVCFKEK